MNRRLDGPQKNLWYLSGFDTRIVQPVALSTDTASPPATIGPENILRVNFIICE